MAEWVCLRGLARGNIHWGEFRTLFDQKNPQTRWLEYPGNGERFAEDSYWKADEYVDDLRRQLELSKNPRKIKILAISLGGMLAVKWAERFPNEVSELVLINTSHASCPITRRLQPKAWGHMARAAKEGIQGNFLKSEAESLEMTLQSKEQIAKHLPLWAEYSQSHPMKGKNLVAQLWVARNSHFPKTAPVKTTVIVAKNDHMVSPECSYALADQWKVKLLVHPWAGHDLPLDDPKGLMELLSKI